MIPYSDIHTIYTQPKIEIVLIELIESLFKANLRNIKNFN